MRPPSHSRTLAAMNPLPPCRSFRWALVGLVLLAAACGSSSGPSSPGVAASTAVGLLAYSSCMRSHGVPDFPDPASSGGIPKETAQQLGVSDAQLDAAQRACAHLIPPGESLGGQTIQTVTPQQQDDYLKAAVCMRAHGIAAFPDPLFSGGRVEFPRLQHLVDIHSPQFTQAYHVCQRLIPQGLPYSGSAG
jgi:predicted alpha/beta-hydrolase family hydrolase